MIESFINDHLLGVLVTMLVVVGVAILSSDMLYLVMGGVGYILFSIKSMWENVRD